MKLEEGPKWASFASWVIVGVAVIVGIIVTKRAEPLCAFSIPMAVDMVSIILNKAND